MKISSLIFCIILFYGCGRQEHKDTSVSTIADALKTGAPSMTIECIQRDTITGMGTRIHYINYNGKYQVSWGDNSYNRVYDSLYTCYHDDRTGLWDFVPKLNSETKNNLIFTNILWTSSGGNPAPLEFCAIICPKNVKDSIFEKEFFIDCKGDYLIHGDFENENIHLINIETKKNQTFILNPKPYSSRSPTLAILKTVFKGKSIYIKYESVDKNDDTIIIERTFKIEI